MTSLVLLLLMVPPRPYRFVVVGRGIETGRRPAEPEFGAAHDGAGCENATVRVAVDALEALPVVVAHCEVNVRFGPGCYTTKVARAGRGKAGADIMGYCVNEIEPTVRPPRSIATIAFAGTWAKDPD